MQKAGPPRSGVPREVDRQETKSSDPAGLVTSCSSQDLACGGPDTCPTENSWTKETKGVQAGVQAECPLHHVGTPHNELERSLSDVPPGQNETSSSSSSSWSKQQQLDQAHIRAKLPADAVFLCRLTDAQREEKSSTLLLYSGTLNGCSATILVDCGATGNFISKSFVERNHLNTCPRVIPTTVTMGDGKTYPVETHMPRAELRVGQYKDYLPLMQASLGCTFDVVLGKPWLARVNPAINWRTDTLHFYRKGKQHVWDTTLSQDTLPHGLEMLSALQVGKLFIKQTSSEACR